MGTHTRLVCKPGPTRSLPPLADVRDDTVGSLDAEATTLQGLHGRRQQGVRTPTRGPIYRGEGEAPVRPLPVEV